MLSLKGEIKHCLRIAIPVSISQLSHMFVGIADTIMAAALGNVELAALTLTSIVFFPILMVGIGISYGQTSIVSQYNGKNLQIGLKKVLGRMMFINLSLGLVLTLIMLLIYPLFFLTNQPIIALETGKNYYTVIAFTFIPIMAFQTLKQFSEGLAKTNIITGISLAGNILNVMLNIPMAKIWGIDGIAWATFISRVFMTFLTFLWFFKDGWLSEFLFYSLQYIIQFNYEFKKIANLLKVSVPVGIQMVLESTAFAFATFLIGQIGITELGAHQISLNIAATAYMFATGFGASSTVRVAYAFGKANFFMLKKTIFANIILILFYNMLTAFIFYFWGEKLAGLYTRDSKILFISSNLLKIAAMFQFSDGLQVVLSGILRGLLDVKIPAMMVIFSYWFIGLPVGYWLMAYNNMGVVGIWYGLLTGLLCVSLFLFLRVIYRYKFVVLSYQNNKNLSKIRSKSISLQKACTNL